MGKLPGCPQWLTIKVHATFLSPPSDPPVSHPLPPMHYRGKYSVNKVFNALILALVYGYDVMSQLLRACMPYYCRHCGLAVT